MPLDWCLCGWCGERRIIAHSCYIIVPPAIHSPNPRPVEIPLCDSCQAMLVEVLPSSGPNLIEARHVVPREQVLRALKRGRK